MARGLANILIGVLLAALLALASQFMLAPFFGIAGLGTLKVIGAIVFWGVLLLVVISVLRGRR